MNRPRRVRSPPFGYDPRVMGRRSDSRAPPPDYEEPFAPVVPFDSPQTGSVFIEPSLHHPPPPHHHPSQYPRLDPREDHRLPSTYRATLREPPYIMNSGVAPYKILCITNINPKVSDGPVKDALISDFRRFGDISVNICHDSGERLAYIYFRTYEEARLARHSKSRTMLFDRPLDIEPIFEPNASPVGTESPPTIPQQQPPPMSQAPHLQTQIHSRRHSPTPPPPEYYSMNGPTARRPPQAMSPPQQIPPNHHPGGSPSLNYPHMQGSNYPNSHSPPPNQASAHYNRYLMGPSGHLHPASPYDSPPHDHHRSYHHQPNQILPEIYQQGHPGYPPSAYGPPPPVQMVRERERPPMEVHLSRSPSRHEPYYPMEHHHPHYRPYTSHPVPNHPSRSSSSLHSSSSQHQYHLNSNVDIHHHQHQSSASNRRPLPHPEHPRYMSREFRREKYGSENYSNEPEESRPSRVLFVSNIDPSKTEDDLRVIFDPFGSIDEVEVRKIGPNSSSALIKFSSMDCAYKAKTVTLGKYIGKLKCRISYSRVSASRRLWIGGLGHTTTVQSLQDQFGKFGKIINLDYISGRPYAYVEFESTNQAQFATHHLRGTMVADAEKRLRIEYVDPVERNEKSLKGDSQNSYTSLKFRAANESWPVNERNGSPQASSRKRSITPADVDPKRAPQLPGSVHNNDHRSTTNSSNSRTVNRSRSRSPIDSTKVVVEKSELNNNQSTEDRGVGVGIATNHTALELNNFLEPSGMDKVVLSKSIREIVDRSTASWSSTLVLRNFSFPSKMFMCGGRKEIIDKCLNSLINENEDQYPILKITQRWRLHPQPKLEEVKRKLESGNLGMLIITSRQLEQSPAITSPDHKISLGSSSQTTQKQNGDNNTNDESIDNENNKSTATSDSLASTQSRPLKSLISYLEQKDAAGVISLNASDRNQIDGAKLLYTFPPGDVALNLLKRQAPNLTIESTREEYLLGVIG